jgi:RNA polymerase sigma-70 factor (ECF subfamily)
MTTGERPIDGSRFDGSTSRSLLADARLADAAAWERLVRLYAPLVASWCRRWGVAEQDVADLLQDVFSAVAAHLDRFRGERPADTFRGWLATITRNKVRDHFRRRATQPTGAGGSEASWQLQQVFDEHLQDEMPDAADETLLDDLLRAALESIRGEFHEKTWRAFWGVVVEGRNTADVAADLEMKPGAVRVAKSRVLLRLRRELGDAPQ